MSISEFRRNANPTTARASVNHPINLLAWYTLQPPRLLESYAGLHGIADEREAPEVEQEVSRCIE